MSLRATKLLTTAIAAMVGTSSMAGAYPENLFSVSQLHFDSVREPHGFDWYLKSREARVILSAVSAYMGIDPKYVNLAISAVPTAKSKGEETWYELRVPDGYRFCAARIRVTSIASSKISSNVTPTAMGIYTWTPVQGIGGGRSWAEGDAQVTGIKPEYFEEFKRKGVCRDSGPDTEILRCSGHPCNGTEFGRIQDAGPTTGDLQKGF